MDSTDLEFAGDRSREIVDNRFAGIVGCGQYSGGQSAADSGGVIYLSVLRTQTAAAISGGDWFFPGILRWGPCDRPCVYDGDSSDEFREFIVTRYL